VNLKLEETEKDVSAAYFNMLFRYLTSRGEENHATSHSWCPASGSGIEPTISKYEAGEVESKFVSGLDWAPRHETVWGRWGKDPRIPNLGSRWRWAVSFFLWFPSSGPTLTILPWSPPRPSGPDKSTFLLPLPTDPGWYDLQNVPSYLSPFQK